MKILIAIESCFAHRDRHQAQRDTWIKDLPKTQLLPWWTYSNTYYGEIDYKFFLGYGEPSSDEIFLNAKDSYENLSLKTRDICKWALLYHYDYVYKTDTDTLVSPHNLINNLSFHGYPDYLGGFNEDNMPSTLANAFPESHIQFASGGAGYWLSRKAMELVSNGPNMASPAEDVYVAAILKLDNILPMWDDGYRWRPGSSVDGSMVSLHLSSTLQKKYEPSQMYEYYHKMKEMKW